MLIQCTDKQQLFAKWEGLGLAHQTKKKIVSTSTIYELAPLWNTFLLAIETRLQKKKVTKDITNLKIVQAVSLTKTIL